MKSFSWWFYGLLAGAYVVALAVELRSPPNSIAHNAIGGASVVVLIGAAFQLVRDRATFDRDSRLKREDQQFAVGVTSHMANTVFDRHVTFCEEYMAEVNRTVESLVREGPSKEALEHAGTLYRIRRSHSLWITDKMSEDLEAFEAVVRGIGADSHFISVTLSDATHSLERKKRVKKVFDDFTRLMPIFQSADQRTDNEPTPEQRKREVNAERIVVLVRNLLDIEELSEMRRAIVRYAHNSVMARSKIEA